MSSTVLITVKYMYMYNNKYIHTWSASPRSCQQAYEVSAQVSTADSVQSQL